LTEEHRPRVFDNRGLRKVFGPKGEEEESCRKLYNDEFHGLYSSPIKSRRMRWAGHVARMEEGETFTGFWLGGPKGEEHREDQGVGGRITSRST
jgi:hypothetical protein